MAVLIEILFLILLFMMHAIFVQVAKGGPPVVGYVPYGAAPWLKHYIGTSYPSVRSYVSADLGSIPVGLWERTWNTFYYIMDDLIRQYHYLPINQQLFAEQYIGHKIRPLHEIEKTISIVLINSHSPFDNAIPLPPNALEIGGMHAQIAQPIPGEVPVTYPEVGTIDLSLFKNFYSNSRIKIIS